jgi:tRNA pseudouridine38-40 synthase
MALRRPDFRRFAFSVQYHGSSFLGFTHQGEHQENCILPDGTDLRGYTSVETRLRQALTDLLGANRYENIQVSSRTDRGVHAIKNTFHVDIASECKILQSNIRSNSLVKGINFYLSRQRMPYTLDGDDSIAKKRLQNSVLYERDAGGSWVRQNPIYDVRILNARPAPDATPNPAGELYGQPNQVDWNARFCALQRTYVYRILNTVNDQAFAAPFEWDRSWRIQDTGPLDVDAMRKAALFLTGTHDFSAFRTAGCQRKIPIVTLEDVQIFLQTMRTSDLLGGGLPPQLFGDGSSTTNCEIISLVFRGNSFLYRQVRNMVGCIVEVGKGSMTPGDIQDILAAKQKKPDHPSTAPAHGLFLFDVKHYGIEL